MNGKSKIMDEFMRNKKLFELSYDWIHLQFLSCWGWILNAYCNGINSMDLVNFFFFENDKMILVRSYFIYLLDFFLKLKKKTIVKKNHMNSCLLLFWWTFFFWYFAQNHQFNSNESLLFVFILLQKLLEWNFVEKKICIFFVRSIWIATKTALT